MEEHYSVAIDGPSGAGKSTIARAAAKRFGFLYIDTGAIDRTVGLAVDRQGFESGDEESVEALLPKLDISLGYGRDGIQREYLNGEDVTGLIRSPEISRRASEVSVFQSVRAFLLDMQRSLARENCVVMDGRDIGTVVLPEADLKVFLTASPERRAERRLTELEAAGCAVTFNEVLHDILERDERDSQRSAAPLRRAWDAIEVDTSEMTLSESINAVCSLMSEKLGVREK